MLHRLPDLAIPKEWTRIVEGDQTLAGVVWQAATSFGAWIGQNRLTFFPEYTDHSLRHVESVLATAWYLVRTEARRLLGPADAALMILSSILHDSAMHLDIDGVVRIIAGDALGTPAPGFQDKPWPVLWNEYLAEVQRYDENRRLSLFGDVSPLRTPRFDLDMSLRDIRVVGEFIRRHHHRLAHEIALHGVPGPGSVALALPKGDPIFCNLVGLVARSHGMALRETLPYLGKRAIQRVSVVGAHVPFVMILLRIADYLQVERQRANPDILKVRSLKSPVSRVEWSAHAAVQQLSWWGDDPEAMEIIAEPEDVRTYLKLSQWISGIQEELDVSWAVLGELYGRDKRLRPLGIQLRRVSASFEDTVQFSKSVGFVPRHVGFSVSCPELLPLLIGPLYGNDPSFGVRELIQNAVDAVRERWFDPVTGTYCEGSITPEVVVSLDANSLGHSRLCVEDTGVGMNADKICGYFLKAGASFRNSVLWQQKFVSPEGEVRVLRSGRFGIGVLAAFLLGDEIDVHTRDFQSDEPGEGLRFCARIYTDPIELLWEKRDVGTSVGIELHQQVATRMAAETADWDWYCLDWPAVRRLKNGVELKQRFHVPGPRANLPAEWRRLEHQDYEDIQWSYTAHSPDLICNGFVIGRADPDEIRVVSRRGDKGEHLIKDEQSAIGSLGVPHLSVFDRNALLPLTLDRMRLQENVVPFVNELRGSIIEDLIAYSMAQLEGKEADELLPAGFTSHAYPGLMSAGIVSPWTRTPAGITLLDGFGLTRSRPDVLILSHLLQSNDRLSLREQERCASIVVTRQPSRESGAIGEWWAELVLVRSVDTDGLRRKVDLGITGLSSAVRGARLVLDEQTFEAISRRVRLTVEDRGEDWILVSEGQCPSQPIIDFSTITRWAWNPVLHAEWYLSADKIPDDQAPVAKLWRKRLGQDILPFQHPSYRELANSIRLPTTYFDAWLATLGSGKTTNMKQRG